MSLGRTAKEHARSRRAAHGLAHVCVCALAFLSLSLPAVVNERRGAHVSARMSDDEADVELQRAASRALGGREGAVIVLDAQTGRVRALSGTRTAFAEATPPGSAIKPFTMLTALRAGVLDADTRTFCRGRYAHEEFHIACSHPRYRTAFNPVHALANSCNYFFGHTAEQLSGDAYARTLSSFGFGARTGGGEDAEVAGQLPRETPRVQEMLGESDALRVTPAQLVTAYAALFNGGRLLSPQRSRAEGFEPRERARFDIAPEHRALLLAGMRGAVAYGTAARAGLATLDTIYVFGKTGTATPQDDWRAQGWFVGFAADKSSSVKNSGGESSNDQSSDSDASVYEDSHDAVSNDANSFNAKAPPERVRLAVLVFFKRSRGAEAADASRHIFEAYARTLRGRAEGERGGEGEKVRKGEGERGRRGEGETFDDEDSVSPSPRLPVSPSETTVRVRLSREDATIKLALDDYVFGVLAAEGSVESEMEALKALAVIARTYAVKNLRRHARDRFDLCDTTHCQRFLPVRDESVRPDFYELVRRAVSETAGEVLQDSAGRAAEVYFSASCGGETADISTLWNVRNAPAHLRGVRDDACAGATAPWTDVIPAARLAAALRADERSDVGAHVDAVRVVRRDATGRAQIVSVEGERRRLLSGWDFKIIVGRALGWSVLKSSRFDVARAGASFVFRGTGFGHGLGLCQTGAHRLAARGASYRQILADYFPGTSMGELRSAEVGLRSERDDRLRVDEGDAVETVEGDGELRALDKTVGAGLVPARLALSRAVRFVQQRGQGQALPLQQQRGQGQALPLQQQRGQGQALPLQFYPQASPVFRLAAYRPQTPYQQLAPVASSIQNPKSKIQNRLSLSSEHFRVSYPSRASRRDVEAALRVLESAHADVARRFERASLRAPTGATEVFIHETTGDFTGATGRPAWVAATTEGRRIELQPVAVLRRRGVLDSTLRHEFVHAALEASGEGRAPLWLVEGLAVLVAGEGASLARTASKQKIAIEELERRLASPSSPREMRALYAAAYAEVNALIRRDGEASVWRRAAR